VALSTEVRHERAGSYFSEAGTGTASTERGESHPNIERAVVTKNNARKVPLISLMYIYQRIGLGDD
jgi:hypothetical protein